MCVGIREESGPSAALQCVLLVEPVESAAVKCSTVLWVGERGAWRGDSCCRLFISGGTVDSISWMCFFNTSAGVCSSLPPELRGGRRRKSPEPVTALCRNRAEPYLKLSLGSLPPVCH